MHEGEKSAFLVPLRWKYHRVSKKEKGGILDAVCERLGCHRKHAPDRDGLDSDTFMIVLVRKC